MILKNIINLISTSFYQDENSTWLLRVFWNSLYIAFFLLPLDINSPTPFFILAIVLGIVNIFKSDKKISKENRLLFLFPVYFLLLCASLLYTENLKDGWELVQRSLTLFLFPVIFMFVKEDALSVRKLFDFMMLGLVVSFFVNLYSFGVGVYSLENISTETILSYFMQTEFSGIISSSYVSLYILLVLSYYLKKKLENKKQVFILLILFLYLFMLASKISFLMLGIMSVLLIISIPDKTYRYTMILTFMLGVFVFLSNPKIYYFTALKGHQNTNLSISENSRFLSWKAAIKTIEAAPLLGYGVGDANDALIQKYEALGYARNYERRFNAHNQFLQTWLQVGVPGVILLFFIFGALGMQMRRSSNEVVVFLILLMSLMFESMLVRFNGIVFFSIIVPLLMKKRSILSSRIIRNDPKVRTLA